jgi:hypothetical protein
MRLPGAHYERVLDLVGTDRIVPAGAASGLLFEVGLYYQLHAAQVAAVSCS